MKFYYVYILRNENLDFMYIGYSENLLARFKTHNEGKVMSTRYFRPFNLIHYEAYAHKKDAKRREKYLKTNRGRTTLITMLKEYFKD